MKQFLPAIYVVGAVCVLIGVLIYIPYRDVAPYVYLFGALLVGVTQFFSSYKGSDRIIKRLYLQRTFGAAFLILTGVLMITLPHGNEWILSLTLAAIIQLYTAYRIPLLESREGKE